MAGSSSFVLVTDNTDEMLMMKNEAVKKALVIIGLKAEKYAKEECPVRTGRLRNSISHDNDGQTVYVGTNVEYAPYVEMGTWKMDAQPYLRPSIENHIQEYQEIFKETLKQG